MFFLTFLQILQMYVLLLSVGSELSNPNYISHFTDVQPSPPKIDMNHFFNSLPPPPTPSPLGIWDEDQLC